ncbi:MAG: polysaccharide deacetylase family protein [Solirubrobacterales bacterium]
MRKQLLVGAGSALAVAIVALSVPGAAARSHRHRDGADSAGPLDMRRVAVDQDQRDIRLAVRTQGKFGLRQLNRRPSTARPTARYLCLHIHRAGDARVRQLCFGPKRHGADELGYARLHRDGSIKSFERIAARVDRHGPRSVVARFRAGAAGFGPHVYFWRYLSHWRGRACHAGAGGGGTSAPSPGARRCADVAPDHRWAKFRLRPVQPVGCVDSGSTPRFNGSRGRKRVALTFDDGPSVYTPKVLKVLEHKHARATFFEIGAQVPGLASSSRAVVESGDELGNHSLHHESHPGAASMAETSRRIEHATGFTPCLFRPPGGAFDWRVVSDARSLGMTTIVWDVDPTDWSTPGTDAIYSRVVSHTRPGSIVVMHDGGGNRSQTVAALPRIIDTLRGRGYRFVTVSKLLGQRTIWGSPR